MFTNAPSQQQSAQTQPNQNQGTSAFSNINLKPDSQNPFAANKGPQKTENNPEGK